MPYEIIFGPSFKRSVKALQKRFPSVKRDVELAIEVVLENPSIGTVIPGSSGVRKVRVKNSDLGGEKEADTGCCIILRIRNDAAPIC